MVELGELEDLASAVSSRYGITPFILRHAPGWRDARMAFGWVAGQRGFSSVEIAHYLGANHSSVLHQQRRMELLLAALVGDGGL